MSWQHEHIKANSFSTMIKPSYYILIFASTTVLQTTEYWPSQLYFSVPLFKLIGLMQELLYPLKKKKKKPLGKHKKGNNWQCSRSLFSLYKALK